MRTTSGGGAGVCVTAALGHAGDREDALAIIEQAVKAHGGDDALAKAAPAVRNGEGVMYQAGKEVKFTDEMTLEPAGPMARRRGDREVGALHHRGQRRQGLAGRGRDRGRPSARSG